MHDLQTVGQSCKERLEAMGIRCGAVCFELDTRARRRWGSCRKLPDGSCRIGISPKLLEAPLEALENTLYHELLHAATDVTGHTGPWKAMAAYVSRTLGTQIRRTATFEDKGMAEAEADAPYRFVCTGCGALVLRYRACPFTRRPGRYRCSRCGKPFRRVSADHRR